MVHTADRSKRRPSTAASSGGQERWSKTGPEGPSHCPRRTPISPLSLRTPTIQPKLTVNPPGDKYEQEADAIAARVVHSPAPVTQPDQGRESIQRQPEDNLQRQAEEEDAVQMQVEEEEPVQMQVASEENAVQMQAEEEAVQRQLASEEEEPVQTQPADKESEEKQAEVAEPVQMQETSDEEEVPV
ncbi:hypothetical protein C7271_24105, partial [filamentous cyanobacterium CCP5]